MRAGGVHREPDANLSSERVPALVLGGPWHTTLSVVRALAQQDIPQFTVGANASYVAYSRWHRALPSFWGPEPTPGTLASFLARLPVPRLVLVPCSDDWVAAVASLDAETATRFCSSTAPLEAIDICLDKGRFAETLTRLGLPHPGTICLTPTDDAWALSQTLTNPFLKPRHSTAFHARYGAKAFQVTTREDLERWIGDARLAGLSLMLQEFVPGPATSHYLVDGFVDGTGSMRARFARRRIRTYPEPFGESSCMESIRLEEACEPIALLDRLLDAIDYRGVFSAHFKRDEGDGLFKFIEVNPRVWGGVALPVSCGVNVVEMAYRDAQGMGIPSVMDYPTRRRWVHGSRDAAACWRLWRAGEIALRDCVDTWAGAVQPIIRWDDPVPAVMDVVHLLRQAARRSTTGSARTSVSASQ